MATNRTKIDWAYKQAVRIHDMGVTELARWASVRKIAAILRRAEKRGAKPPAKSLCPYGVEDCLYHPHAHALPLTAGTIRECKKQLEAVAVPMNDVVQCTHFMIEERAYQAYENYAKLHRATLADPLRTFSGWLQHMNIKIIEEQSK